MKKHSWIRALLLDILAAGAALTVFALFHHVLPREQQALNVQTVHTAQAAETKEETETAEEIQTAEVLQSHFRKL